MKPYDQAEHDGYQDGLDNDTRRAYRWRGGDQWGIYLVGRDRGREVAEEAANVIDLRAG